VRGTTYCHKRSHVTARSTSRTASRSSMEMGAEHPRRQPSRPVARGLTWSHDRRRGALDRTCVRRMHFDVRLALVGPFLGQLVSSLSGSMPVDRCTGTRASSRLVLENFRPDPGTGLLLHRPQDRRGLKAADLSGQLQRQLVISVEDGLHERLVTHVSRGLVHRVLRASARLRDPRRKTGILNDREDTSACSSPPVRTTRGTDVGLP